MAHPNEDLLRRGYAAFEQGDVDTLLELWADDIAWHAKGDTPLSGEFRGPQEILGNFAKIPELTDSFKLELHDILANDEHAVAIVTVRAERGGQRIEGNAVHVYHLADGKVTEAWIIQEDQAAFEEFWAD